MIYKENTNMFLRKQNYRRIKVQMAKTKGLDAKWIIVIGLVLLVAWQMGLFTIPVTTVPGIPSPTPTDAWSKGGFNVGFTDAEENAYSGAALGTTSSSYRVFHSNGRRLSSVSTLYGESGLALSGATSVNFAILGSDNGIVFVSLYTGTADVPSIMSVRLTNPGYGDAKWMDVDTPNLPRLVVELDLKKYGTPNLNVDPSIRVDVKVRGADEDTGITMSAPADQTSIGTTAGTEKTVEWTITAITANAGAVISELYITSNQTSTDFECFEVTFGRNQPIKMNDAWASTVSQINVLRTSGTAAGITQTWTYIDSDAIVANAYLVGDPTGGNDGLSITLRVKCYFTVSNHGATCVLNLKLSDADGTVQTVVTDSMELRC